MSSPDSGPTRMMRRGKILYALVMVMMLAALVPLVVTSAILIRQNRNALALSEELVQLDQTRSIAKQARLYLQAMHDQVVGIAQTFGIGDSPWAVSERIARAADSEDLIHYIQDGSHLLSISVQDTRQRGGGYALYDFSDEQLEAYYERSLNTSLAGSHYVSAPYVSETMFDTVLVISAPIVASGQVAGVVSAVVSLQPIQEMVEGMAKEGREVYVVDVMEVVDEAGVVGKTGRLVFHSNRETLFTNPSLVGNQMVEAFKESSGYESRLVNFQMVGESGNARMVGTYTPIGERNSKVAFLRELDWGAVVQAKEEAVYYSVREVLWTSVWWALSSGLFAVVLSVVFAGRLSQPIARLAEGARRLAAGDFSRDIEVTSRNEIGELADTFNLMKAEIKSYVQRLQTAAEENKQMFMGAVSSLAAAIDAKDPYTRGHSERVSNFAEKIAGELGLPESDVEVVRISALMHDVGKIGVEDKILGKEGPLTDDEYEIMKTHPVKGAVIMEQVPQLKEMIPGMKYHHENVNGTGYPEGLRGDEIPLTAKIVSVADCFDAMTTNRPYQKAMDITYVLERMRSFVGKKFDREVVEALIKAYEEGSIRPNMPIRQTVSFASSEQKMPAVVTTEQRR